MTLVTENPCSGLLLQKFKISNLAPFLIILTARSKRGRPKRNYYGLNQQRVPSKEERKEYQMDGLSNLTGRQNCKRTLDCLTPVTKKPPGLSDHLL